MMRLHQRRTARVESRAAMDQGNQFSPLWLALALLFLHALLVGLGSIAAKVPRRGEQQQAAMNAKLFSLQTKGSNHCVFIY